jgi:exonuclease SbcC
MRSADTLSGGETFLASLALALQLSEQVQHAAGATMLDSLFIDEGFGTLDPEALVAAASAIESLPVGGRMVGIITHIEELSSRLPARVKLGKTSGGSRMTVETG